MSQTIIEKLLKGAEVEWEPLGEIAEIGTGSSNREDEKEGGQYPLYVRSKFILRSDNYEFDETAIIIPGEGGIGDIFHYVQGKYALHQRAYRIHLHSKDINSKFIYYFICGNFKKYVSKKLVGSTSLSIRKPMLQNFLVPIPKLSVQKEIVRILDAFTAHTTELIAELTAELNERKKQYNYYRDKLLTFSDEQVKWETIEEIFTLKNGYTPSKSVKEYWIGGTVPWFRMEDIRASGRMLTESAQKVHINGVKGKLFPNNSIIMSTSATVGEHALILTDFLCNQRFTNFSVREKYKLFLNIKYVYYYFFIIDQKAKETISISSFPSVQMDALKKWLFPIPPLSVQKEIVRKLDAFSMLTTSISAGLPREIELRNKQYKYYRGQLLNFSKPDLEI